MTAAASPNAAMLKKLIDDALIDPSLAATDKEATLRMLLARLVEAGRVDKKHLAAMSKRLLAREKLGSTGIGNGIAVPHVKAVEVRTTSIAVARLPEGMDYDAIDGRPVHGIFLIVAPQAAAEEHLQVLRWVSSLARSADFRRFLAHAAGEREIRELLTEML